MAPRREKTADQGAVLEEKKKPPCRDSKTQLINLCNAVGSSLIVEYLSMEVLLDCPAAHAANLVLICDMSHRATKVGPPFFT